MPNCNPHRSNCACTLTSISVYLLHFPGTHRHCALYEPAKYFASSVRDSFHYHCCSSSWWMATGSDNKALIPISSRTHPDPAHPSLPSINGRHEVGQRSRPRNDLSPLSLSSHHKRLSRTTAANPGKLICELARRRVQNSVTGPFQHLEQHHTHAGSVRRTVPPQPNISIFFFLFAAIHSLRRPSFIRTKLKQTSQLRVKFMTTRPPTCLGT
ncbi:hypothetical protein BKA65DRAFT_505079 [Rhexocercosporidium sp. MPI-PUGE-AT-0058]|nr:hypothetical protein BKA65DRAFT_505079 [Rhexocercosporidium sp. MPI-PUGE-AT-0058]